jgi:hypothetical protein
MPSSPDDFCNLSIPQQFAYTKSVLVAILNERYPPARERHSDFMKGGALRRKLAENAGARGMMSPIDVEELQRCLLKWTLRDERWAKQMADDEMPNNDTLTVKDAATKNDGANDQAGDVRAISFSCFALVE